MPLDNLVQPVQIPPTIPNIQCRQMDVYIFLPLLYNCYYYYYYYCYYCVYLLYVCPCVMIYDDDYFYDVCSCAISIFSISIAVDDDCIPVVSQVKTSFFFFSNCVVFCNLFFFFLFNKVKQSKAITTTTL